VHNFKLLQLPNNAQFYFPIDKWAKIANGKAQQPDDVSLMTFVRNSIHHPENTSNGGYTPQELKSSIEELMKLIKNP